MIRNIGNSGNAHPARFCSAHPPALADMGGGPSTTPAGMEGTEQQAAARGADSVPPGTYLQYMGFGQTGTVRAYRFRRISRGEKTREYIVNADLTLFAKYHVGIQEGPALCAHLLSRSGGACAAPGPAPDSLTDADMLAHLRSRPAAQTKAGRAHTS